VFIFCILDFTPNYIFMPIEIRELVIKATVALDWENKTVTEMEENIVCLRLPGDKYIAAYVKQYFKQQRLKALSFDQLKLTAFLVEWQASLLK
jgi:hypothetical protein